MSESQLEAGERRTAADGNLLALSPKPAKTGAQPADSTDWVRRKNDIWMDLQGGNLVFAAEFSLMFLSLGILALALVGFLPSLITWSVRGYFDWGMPLFILVGNIFCTLPFGLVFHLTTNKAVNEGPPIRLNRQKREIAIPHWVGGSEFKMPYWGDGFAGTAYIVFLVVVCGYGVNYFAGPWDVEGPNIFLRGVNWIAGVSGAILIPYIAVGLYLSKKSKPRLTYIYHPWEQLVAFIQKQQVTAPTILAEQTLLTLAVPDPDNPDSAKAAISINVGHETVGLAQWECLRAFMDDGPSACPDPRDYGTLADYKASCRQARQEKGMAGWLWKKVGDWFFQRYLARLITERRVRKLIPKTLPEQLREWSKPLPEGEWAQPSEKLKALNAQLTAAYRRGEAFTHMGPVSQWLAGEHAKSGKITA
jgi:hypothetical protein